jgi:fructose-1,6-bisphosphatase/inositol monophosphatase family enzyme
MCTSPEGFKKRGLESTLQQLMARSGFTRTWGDCYAYALVATGRAEFVVDPVMAAWDAAALIPILQEAGGAFTDWTGTARFDGGNGVGSNGWLHEEILSVLRSR